MTKIQKWEVLEEKDISPSHWFPLIQAKVKLANGAVLDDYFYSPLDDVAMVFALTRDNKIVLVRQYKHGANDIMIELPAGFKKIGKTLEQTAIEELEEEVGIKTSIDNLECIGKYAINSTKLRNTIYFYFADNLEFNSTQHLDDTEDIEILTKTPKQVLEMIDNQQIWAVETVACILRVYQKYPNIFL